MLPITLGPEGTSPGEQKGVWQLGSIFMCSLSFVLLFLTLWTVPHQAPLSMGFSRQEYWSGLPFPPPGDLPNPGIEPESPTSPAVAGGLFTTAPPAKPIAYTPLPPIVPLLGAV